MSGRATKPLVLLTNDDGHFSPGILTLAARHQALRGRLDRCP